MLKLQRLFIYGLLLAALSLFFLLPDLNSKLNPTTQAQMGNTDARIWDLGLFDQAGQITLFDGPMNISSTGKPVELGDFDGDGCGDVAMTGQNARGGAGQVRLVFGLCERWGNYYDLFQRGDNYPPVVNIYGMFPSEMLGTEVFSADFNGDGYDDLLIGAQNSPSIDRSLNGTGSVYVIFGGADLSRSTTIDMSSPPNNVMVIYGAEFEGRLGMWVSGADVDGDGYPDLILGANQASGQPIMRRARAGVVYVLYGRPDMLARYGSRVDLRRPEDLGDDLTMIIGVDSADLLGSTVLGGDLNNDGYADILMSAALWRGAAGIGGSATGGSSSLRNERYRAGETHILFGSPDLRGQVIDLAELIDEDGAPIDERLTVIYGARPNDYMGEEIALGDINGDGWPDVVVGSLAAPGPPDHPRIDGGEAWLIYGGEDLAGRMIDLAEVGAGVPIYAAEPDSKGGDTMIVVDLDGDGYDDLLYGAPNADVIHNGRLRDNTGILYILYGQEGGLPTTNGIIDLLNPPPDLRMDLLIGADDFDMSAYAMSVMDIDGDGYPDIAMNGMNGDGFNNRIPDSGEIYIISGRVLADYDPPQREEVGLHDEAEASPTSASLSQGLPADFSPPSEQGALLYNSYCAGCHAEDGSGIAGIGYQLLGSPYSDPAQISAAEALAFIREGRRADDPTSKMGRVMPASGGNPSLTDAELLLILQHIYAIERSLNP